MNQQKSDHYKKEIETIEFMKISKGEEATKQFVLLTAFKYWDRLGKKDNDEEDSYKMLDYACYYHFGQWFHEMKDNEKDITIDPVEVLKLKEKSYDDIVSGVIDSKKDKFCSGKRKIGDDC